MDILVNIILGMVLGIQVFTIVVLFAYLLFLLFDR